ncbi:MAG: biopolymer transporter ExbD [Myxococcota bacterium]
MARQRDDSARTFNLVPIMNLATLLIPVLLMGTQFVALKLMDAGPTPRLENPGDDRVEAIVVTVEVSSAGFRISGAEDVLAGPDGQPVLPCAAELCTNAGAYDYTGLRRLLGHVKDAYPWADEVVVVADDSIPYDVLVRAMDAAREDTGERELFPRVRLENR